MEFWKLLVLILIVMTIKGDVCRPDNVRIYLDNDYYFYGNPALEIRENWVYLGLWSADVDDYEYPTIVQFDLETENICTYSNSYLSLDYLKAGT